MRTVIFLGLLTIASALSDLANSPPLEQREVDFFSLILAVAIVMDILEFVVNLMNKASK